MNLKRLIYPLDGKLATLSEHRQAHKMAVGAWVFALSIAAMYAFIYVWSRQ